MERPRGFFTKRTEHFNNIQKEENNKKKAIEQNLTIKATEKVKQEQSPSPKVENLDPNKAPPVSALNQKKTTPNKHERPLKCLETLAQKAGITFDEKYEMEKSQSPAQQVNQMQQNTQQAALQITQEQYQQLQQQLQMQAFANSQPTIHVKQEFQAQQQQQPQGITAADLKQFQDQQLQQMQIVQSESSQSPHAANTQNAQAALQQAVQAGQVPAEWQQRVQLLQQPLPNAQYLSSQLFSPQLVMSGLHGGLGQQPQIQLIAATGKPFQNQITQQMLTSGGKAVQSFGGYTMQPTIPTSQQQTVLFSPVLNSVIGSQSQQQATTNQQNILPNMQAQQTPTKTEQKPITGKNILQKVSQSGNHQQTQSTVTGAVANQQANLQSVQVSQTMPTAQILGGQAMQFAPWIQTGTMASPFTYGLQQVTSPIIIRGTNPDGTPVFIQQSPTQQTQQTVLSPLNQIPLVGNIAAQTQSPKVRPASEGLAPKTQTTPQRAPTILPQGSQIRPASSVSTQTAMNQNANLMAKTSKVRTKQTPVRPAAPNIKVSLNQQTGQPMMQQVVTQGGVNKMVVMSNINGQLTPVLQQGSTQQIISADKLKTQQQQQQQQQHQVILQQMAANMQQQNAVQQQQLQQQIQFQIAQHQQQQLFQQAAQAQAQNQLMAQSGNIQQVVLQQHPQHQIPTVTVASVNMPMSQANTVKQGQVITSQTNSISLPTSIASTHVTSIAGHHLTADTSNSILGPLSSPQTPLQPPQNPLIAMKTLSASPMSNVSVQKEKVDASTGENVTRSPMKRPAEESKTNETKKQATEEKKEESVSTTSPSKSSIPSPSTPNSTTKLPALNSPLALQNGEAESKKATNGNLSMLKNEVPKAMVKPNVLTHVIEGFVIQESNEPFPVTRQRYSEKENDEPSKKKQSEDAKVESPKVNGESSGTSTPNVTSSTSTPLPTDMVACEQCGKQEMRSKLKKKRFCSLQCARARKSTSTDGSPTVTNATNGDDKSDNIVASSPAPSEKSKAENGENGELPPIEEHVMMKWSVAQVCDFIKNLPGCSDYAEDFKLQEIDGQALLLLKENHLVSAMNMKLGPALKIVNKIESMRVNKDGETTETPPDQ